MKVMSKDLILTLPEKKKNKIVEQCLFLFTKTLLNIRDLTQVIGCLASAAIPDLPTPLQYRAIQL